MESVKLILSLNNSEQDRAHVSPTPNLCEIEMNIPKYCGRNSMCCEEACIYFSDTLLYYQNS